MYTKIKKLNKNKKIIRKYIRTLRHSIKYTEQYTAAQLITNKVLTLNCIHQSKNIAMFISIDGEINTDLLIKTLLSINKRIYLPIVPSPSYKSKRLSFAQYTFNTILIRNHLNTYEPIKNNITSFLSIEKLDIIFVPLVACDEYGNRLGMGGGFYDTTLQNHKSIYTNCTLIGLGYDFQKIPSQLLPIEKTDLQLHKIITPSNLL